MYPPPEDPHLRHTFQIGFNGVDRGFGDPQVHQTRLRGLEHGISSPPPVFPTPLTNGLQLGVGMISPLHPFTLQWGWWGLGPG